MGGDQGQNSVLLFRSSILQWDCAAILLRNLFFLLWLASSLLRGWNTPFYNYKLQYSILIQFAIITFCLPVTMVELRIANSSLAFKVSFTSSVRLSQLLPVFRYAVQLFCYAVQLCCYAVQLCCYVVQLCCYANPARSELDVRGLRTKAHSNSVSFFAFHGTSGNHAKNTFNMFLIATHDGRLLFWCRKTTGISLIGVIAESQLWILLSRQVQSTLDTVADPIILTIFCTNWTVLCTIKTTILLY